MQYGTDNLRRRAFALAVVMGLSVSSASGAIDSKIDFPLKTPSEVSELGLLIFEKDRAAWVATDEMTRRKALARDKRLRGWITETSGSDWRVSFVGSVDGVMFVLYDMRVTKKGKVDRRSFNSYKDGIEMSEKQLAMFTARQTALKSPFRACTRNYNTVVLARMDGEEVKGYIVYLLAATTSWSFVQIGGHHRFTLDASGKKIHDQTALSNSCLTLNKGGESTVALMATEPNSNLPREPHVFLSLQHELTFYVSTKDGSLWKVDGALIEKVR